MILQRFYNEKLSQTSYLIGSPAAGEALVVDPNRDIEQYIEAAEAEGLRITHVAETHIHADFVSGSRELAERTGATICLSDEGGEEWRYAFAEEAGAVRLTDGDSFRLGDIRIDVLHTPGHTPEHLTFLVTDTTTAHEPIGAVTGDFIFAGDVGRPDLLETAAQVEGSMDPSARTLFHSLQKFKQQPDYLQIWPGHGAGSACGKAMSSMPQTTVGYERRFNWAFAVEDEEEFVRMVLAGQPEPPWYFAQMKQVNKRGPRVLRGFQRPERLSADMLPKLLNSGAMIIDTRPASTYAEGHVPGTMNIPLDRSFLTWVGWLLPYDHDFHLIADDSRVDEAIRDLALIGLDRVAGYFPPQAVDQWAAEGGRLGTVPQIDTDELQDLVHEGSVTVLDVRGYSEWEAGHLPGVRNVPLGHLSLHMDEIPRDKPVVVHCQSGARSAIAASILKALRTESVFNLRGGFADWQAAGHPVEHGAE